MRKLILVLAVLATSVTAYASSLNMVFIGFQPGGWPVGYRYYVTANGGPIISVMCDDFIHGGSPGQTWEANFTNLGTGDLSLVRFNETGLGIFGQTGDPLTLYHEAGWLLLQTVNATSQSTKTDLNWAVWSIFDSSVLPLLTPKQEKWLDAAQQEAIDGFPGTNFYRVGIYTPVNQFDTNPDDAQEFLTIVPEPGTLMLLGSGIVGLVARKLRS